MALTPLNSLATPAPIQVLLRMLDPDTSNMTAGYASKYTTHPAYKQAILSWLAEMRVHATKQSALKSVAFNEKEKEEDPAANSGSQTWGGKQQQWPNAPGLANQEGDGRDLDALRGKKEAKVDKRGDIRENVSRESASIVARLATRHNCVTSLSNVISVDRMATYRPDAREEAEERVKAGREQPEEKEEIWEVREDLNSGEENG